MYARRFTVRPHSGKSQSVEARLKTRAAIGNAHGLASRVSSIIEGPTAGCLAYTVMAPTMAAALKGRTRIVTDPKWLALEKERQADPLADRLGGTTIVRFVSGAPDPANFPVSLIRIYNTSRGSLPELLKVGEDARKIATGMDMNLAMGIPILSDSMSRFIVVYQARSLDHLGESIDKVVAMQEYQDVLVRAAALGSIATAVIDVTV
jgi:hypothetical protein